MKKLKTFFRAKYNIDFSLIPIGVLLMEFSVFNSEIKNRTYLKLTDLVLMRLLHTILILILASLTSKILQKLKKTDFSYLEICAFGFPLSVCGVIFNRTLSDHLNIENTSLSRHIVVAAIQNLIWLPGFMVIGSIRSEIFKSFRHYEQRLITSVRIQNRDSDEFRNRQTMVQNSIRQDLIGYCTVLRNSILTVNIEKSALPDANTEIQAQLGGQDLRQFSMQLENFGSEQRTSSVMRQNFKSFRLLTSQFKVLYETTSQIAPLKAQTYAFVLLVLITPSFATFLKFNQAIFIYPLVALIVYLCARVITKVVRLHSKNYLRNSSILIFITALIPLTAMSIRNYIYYNEKVILPIYIGLITLPAAYYVFVKLLQVLKVQAIDLVQKDLVTASPAVKAAIGKLVDEEYSHALSHRWAVYIHGKILTRLAATALKLESSTKNDDHKSFTSAVEELSKILADPASQFDQEMTELDAEIASRLDPWLGLIEITLHIDQELKAIRNLRVKDFGEVIEELISNSMRHGKARKMNLRVMRMGDKDISISAIDDAEVAPPIFQSRYGLGTRIFNLASDGRWSIDRVGSNTVFNLIMEVGK